MKKFFRKLRLKEFFSDHSRPNEALGSNPAVNDSNDSTASPPPPPPPPSSPRSLGALCSQNAGPHPLPNNVLDPPDVPPTKSFRGKSYFIPPKYRNASLDTYCRLVENDVGNILGRKREYKIKDNLSQLEREELKILQKDNSLVIQSADKGGSIVILDHSAYDKEIRRQLGNAKFYRKLGSNPVATVQKRTHTLLNQLLERGSITKPEYEFMKVDNSVTPVFYTLPKVHKDFEDTPPGRPILAAIGSITEKISAFVDHALQPLVTALPSYTRDSMDFIEGIKPVLLNESDLFVTMDIEALYTHVPFEGGLLAAKHYLDKRTDASPDTRCILDLLECILTSNYFLYGTDFYLQVSGVAMGSRMSPSFSSLYVGWFEETVIFNDAINPHIPYISNWRRYLDDIFFTWSGSETQLKAFHEFMNQMTEHLNFTMSADPNSMSFLDILIKKDGNTVKTDLFRKSTDRNSLLHGDSFHPRFLKKNLPVSQFNRIRRICSSNEDYLKQSTVLKERFKQRGYRDVWIEEAASRFDNTSQEECLSKRGRRDMEPKLTCCIQYSPQGRDIELAIKKYWHIVASDPHLQKCGFDTPPMLTYKRPPNLRNMLVRSDIPPQPAPTHFLSQIPSGNYKCGNCQQCVFTRKSHTFKHPQSGKTYYVKGIISCKTEGIIYMIRCERCNMAYIGKSTRALKTRITEHRSAIRRKDPSSPVAVHFASPGHDESSFSYMGIEAVKRPRRGGDLDNLLLKRELFWLFTLNTLEPNGMNQDFCIRPFL